MVTGKMAVPMALILPMTERYRLCGACGLAWPVGYKIVAPVKYRTAGKVLHVEKSEVKTVQACLCGADLLSLPCGQLIRVVEKKGEMHGPEVL